MGFLRTHRLLLASAAILLALAAAWWNRRGGDDGARFKTAVVTRGDLVVTIDATGTVEPEEVIDVGAQVAGRIVEFGTGGDGRAINYGSEVPEGAVLARIDDSLYVAEAAQARAQLVRARAELEQLSAVFARAERDWKRAERLGPSDALARSSYDSYRSEFDAARAGVAVGRAAVAQAEAALGRAEQNLAFCVIRSPVAGIIIDRRVNIGQTVVASLNAPSLFLIAKDLKRMQVWVSVNEADVGRIRQGQKVSFTVDAFPGASFEGLVGRVRLNATMTQNVVSYIVEVLTDNSDGKLLPYLTANVRFRVAERTNVLLVPNAALRWSPSREQIHPAARGEQPAAPSPSADAEPGTLWAAEGGFVRPVPVLVGGSDGASTEVSGEGIEGREIVIGALAAAEPEEQAGGRSPFAPALRGRRGGQRQP